ncbi:DJ-1/PfpI family protein [Achromobacter aloeverae]|uniref:DJ-1/PfpI family protein n=1 Tax=Achromobacter aloeverae TaxID=1750518 RepID=UPI001F01D5D4|nr:DJ-1/PfpI family protein [Achromobacter aloeverae]
MSEATVPGPRHVDRAPRIAVVGHNQHTELTDFVIPYALLKRAEVAEVWAVGTEPGPMRFFPALKAQPDLDIAAFDDRFPDGADYVVVPAVHEDNDPRLLAWVRSQWEKGAVVVGVCDGAWVLAHAGLLDGRAATTHWYSRERLFETHPAVRRVDAARYVVDGRVVTTTGVSASVPVTLALIEAIAGRQRALAMARALGLAAGTPLPPPRPSALRPGISAPPP